MDVGGAFEAMVRAVRNAGRPGVVGYAISAVDVALWDLKARLLGVSLPRLLGAVRTEVPVYGSGGFTTYDDRQLHDQLSGWALEQRIPRVKIKIGESWGTGTERDLDRMTQARKVIGRQHRAVRRRQRRLHPQAGHPGDGRGGRPGRALVRGAGLLRRPRRAAARSATPSQPTSPPASTATT